MHTVLPTPGSHKTVLKSWNWNIFWCRSTYGTPFYTLPRLIFIFHSIPVPSDQYSRSYGEKRNFCVPVKYIYHEINDNLSYTITQYTWLYITGFITYFFYRKFCKLYFVLWYWTVWSVHHTIPLWYTCVQFRSTYNDNSEDSNELRQNSEWHIFCICIGWVLVIIEMGALDQFHCNETVEHSIIPS